MHCKIRLPLAVHAYMLCCADQDFVPSIAKAGLALVIDSYQVWRSPSNVNMFVKGRFFGTV